MEVIENIEETSFRNQRDGYSTEMDGYRITTDRQVILVGIDNSQSCCENWGYLTSEDDLRDFIGAQLSDIRVTDTALNTAMEAKIKDLSLYEGSCMFVTFDTSKGSFQFVAYNDHNGYYGHNAVVISNQVTESDIL
jgi:hypothetical protein